MLVGAVKMAKKWQNTLLAKQGFHRHKMPKHYPYKEPVLSKPADYDLTKQWVVVYGLWSEQQQKIIRKRVVITGKTVKERMADADDVIKLILKELKGGAYVEPLEEPEPSTAPVDLKQSILIKESIDYYLETINSSLSKASRRTYKTCGTAFRNYLTEKKLSKMKLQLFGTPQVYGYTDYLSRERKMGNRNFNKHRGWLFSFFEFYRKRKILEKNPVKEAEVKKKKVSSGQHIPFRPEQIEEIVAYFQQNRDDQFWLFLNCIYYLFARPHEELRLVKVRHLFERTLHINPTDSKDGDNNHKIIPAPLNALFDKLGVRDYPPHFYLFSKSGTPGPDPVGESYFYSRHKKMLNYLGFPAGYDLYGWKHTGVIALYQATEDMKLIQQQCGHSTITQTDEYLRDLGQFLDYKVLDNFPQLESPTPLKGL